MAVARLSVGILSLALSTISANRVDMKIFPSKIISCRARRAPLSWYPAARLRNSINSKRNNIAIMRSTSTSSDGSNRTPRFNIPSNSPLSRGLLGVLGDEKFQKLVRDIFSIAEEVGVEKSIQRSILVSRAGIAFAADVAANPNEYLDPTTNLPSPPKVLRGLFERLGATYIKLGQFIASSPTLFPEEYVLEFQKCLDKTPPTDFSVIEKIIEADLGQPISAFYSKVDPVPLASASVAQVHKGILKSTGEEVAIKVRKPGVDASLSADLGFILAAAKTVEYINPDLSGVSLAGIVEDLRIAMIGELDFRKEADNLKKFKNFLKSYELTKVTCPEVIEEASGSRVLTMEYLDGVPLIDLDSIRKFTLDPEATLVSALNAWTLSVISNDFFHADVHAGNLLVLRDGRVAFIDFGIVGAIPPKIWDAIQDLSLSFSNMNYQGMAAALVAMGATKSEVDVDKFGQDIKRILSNIDKMDSEMVVSSDGMSASAQIAVDQEEVTRLLIDIVNVAEENGVRLPREFGLLVKQALYFDRYTRLLAPELNMMTDDRIAWKSNDMQSGSTRRGGGYPENDYIDVDPL